MDSTQWFKRYSFLSLERSLVTEWQSAGASFLAALVCIPLHVATHYQQTEWVEVLIANSRFSIQDFGECRNIFRSSPGSRKRLVPDPVQIIPGWCACALTTTLFALHVPDNMHLFSILTRLGALFGSPLGTVSWIPITTSVPDHPLCCEKDLFMQLPRAKNSLKEFLTSESYTHSQLMETCFTETD